MLRISIHKMFNYHPFKYGSGGTGLPSAYPSSIKQQPTPCPRALYVQRCKTAVVSSIPHASVLSKSSLITGVLCGPRSSRSPCSEWTMRLAPPEYAQRSRYNHPSPTARHLRLRRLVLRLKTLQLRECIQECARLGPGSTPPRPLD